jgi:hypothetical protein
MSFAAKDSANRPFKTKKALKMAVEHGEPEAAVFRDTSIVSPRLRGASFYRDGLREGDVIEGPDPEGGVPNSWYARVVMKNGHPTIR